MNKCPRCITIEGLLDELLNLNPLSWGEKEKDFQSYLAQTEKKKSNIIILVNIDLMEKIVQHLFFSLTALVHEVV